MQDRNLQHLSRFTRRPPATDQIVAAIEASLGQTIRTDLREFWLKKANGGEGFVGESYLVLDAVEDILHELHDDESEIGQVWKTHRLLVIGSDGGGELFAIDDSKEQQFCMVPMIGLADDSVIGIAKTFESFLDRLAKGEMWDSP